MHITLETDYAIRIVDFMVKNDGRFDAKAISEKTYVPQTFAMKILRKLGNAGIVNSYKGTKGGYELGRSPSELSLYDVVEAVEVHICSAVALTGIITAIVPKTVFPAIIA